MLKLSPSFKEYIWGGTKLKTHYGISELERVAEAWVLSAHSDGPSYLSDGTAFIDVLKTMDVGEGTARFDGFPQLIKLIDAADNLSIQVHPSDEYALEHEGQFGKTEMWYILDAEEGAGIYYGFKRLVTREEVEESIRNNTLTELLQFVPVKKGENYFISAGTVHAIGKGLLIAEIQQNSNVTYRMYDYDRRDVTGNMRSLHVEKALDVATLSPVEMDKEQNIIVYSEAVETKLAECDYFKVSHLRVNGRYVFAPNHSFIAILVINGEGIIENYSAKKYELFFAPADYGSFVLSGQCEVLVSCV